MRTIVSVLLLFFITILMVPSSWAQQCFGITIKEGGGFEMTSFNAKGKADGTVRYRFKEIRQEDGFTAIDVEMESLSSKGKSEYSQKFTMKCNGDEVFVDASSLVMEDQLKSLESFNMSFTSNDIVYPNQLDVGQSLRDASLSGSGDMSGIPILFEMNIKDRKVESKESLKVGAGEFEAYKITASNRMTTKTIANISLDFQTISYRAPGVLWDVKTETYRKGKLMGFTELSKIF